MDKALDWPHRLDRRHLMCGLGATGLSACASLDGTKTISEASLIGRRVAEDYLSRPDIMMYSVKDVTAVHYAEAGAAYGAAKLAGLMRDKPLLTRVVDRYQRILKENIPNTANHVDANVFGVWPLELFQQTGETDYRTAGLKLADGQWERVGADGLTLQTRYWIDDVWMIGALQVQAFRVTGNPVYIDRAGREAQAYIERLQQPNGLFHHGPKAPFFWGRGNGWVAAGLAEVLSDLPSTHPSYPAVFGGYQRMMQALLKYQSPDGMWRQLIDHETAWPESSATAMFGFAFSLGVRRGILTPSYAVAAQRAWAALLTHLGPDGKLSRVCVGTGQSHDERYYLDRATVTGDLHGQAPLLWLASERLRT